MKHRVTQALTLLVPLRRQVEAARGPLVIALIDRGYPRPDAERLVQDAIDRTQPLPGSLAAKLASLHEHAAFLHSHADTQATRNSHGVTSQKRST